MIVDYVTSSSLYGGINTYAEQLSMRLTKYKSLSLKRNTVKSILGCPIIVNKKSSTDFTHFTNQEIVSPLVMRHKRCIITVHDLTVKKLDLFTHSSSRWRSFASWIYSYKLKSLAKAFQIIAVSQNTKNDIISDFRIPEEKISVTYEGVDSSFRILPNIKRERNTLLYVGNELPHKNLPALFKAIAIVKKSLPDVKLTKIGMPGWPGVREQLTRLAEKLDITESITFKDKVNDVVCEYNSAQALVFPSLYEGFGLPVLEAMACGCPVITSKRSSIPEVAGDAALYFNPEDPFEIAERILLVLSNPKLKKNLAKKGIERARVFSWDKCAQETLSVYSKL